MMNKQKILSEGRYDSFVREIVKDIFSSIKETEGELDDTTSFELPYDLTGEEEYIHESGVKIPVEVRVLRTDETITYGNRELPYHVNSYVSDDDFLVLEVVIDETYGREFYEEMFYKISEDVRHEIEHYIQELDRLEKEAGKEEKERRFKDRQQPLRPDTSGYETTFEHHMDPSEVEALVHGFYRRAKLEKKPLDVVMMEDIKKDILDGNLTPEEGDILLTTWLRYSIKNLPKAQYSNETKRRIVIQK